MEINETISELLQASTDGTITTAQVTKAGLHRSVLQKLVDCGRQRTEQSPQRRSQKRACTAACCKNSWTAESFIVTDAGCM